MKTIIANIILAIIFCSCTTTPPSEYIRAEPTYYCIPEIGVKNTVYIGESLIKEGKMTAQDAIYLNNSHGSQGWTTYHQAGIYKLIGRKNGLLIYQCDFPDPYNWGKYSQLAEDTDGKVYILGYSGRILLNPSEYTKRQHIEESGDNFEQTLIYTGAQGTVLRFSYREFSNNMARATFTVDATYDIKNDNIIRFRGASLEVIHIDNQSITYKLISGFQSNR